MTAGFLELRNRSLVFKSARTIAGRKLRRS